MTWEKRESFECRYFTLTRRRNGRRERVYFGKNSVADLASTLVEIGTFFEGENRSLKRQDQAVWDALSSLATTLDQGLDYLLQAHLILAGFRYCYRHWKPPRKGTVLLMPAPSFSPVPTNDFDLAETVRQARAGESVNPVLLRCALAENSPLWQRYGNLSGQLRRELIRLASGADQALVLSLEKQLINLEKNLHQSGDGPLEKLLIERVASGWLEVHYLDLVAVQNPGLTAGQFRELHKRQMHAQHRYAQAIQSLTRLRKLKSG